MTPLQKMTIAQLESKAAEYVEKYDDRFKKVARNAFMEAVSWAIQVANGEIKVKD